ncbi:MAG: S49 family peptidase [Caldilineaceae bacterium]|nr:S49 family peptidase [Caldilineaceae bacterium]
MTQHDAAYALGASASSKRNAWEFPLAIGFLALCLVAGLFIGETNAPTPTIGVIRFADIIYPDSANRLIQVVNAAMHDDSIAGVVLEIDSPGGYATSSENIFYSLLQLRKEKPLVVNIDSIAASGGYYMAVTANRIYAAPSAYIGNVGVRGPRPFDPYIDPTELSTGPYKLAGASRFDQIHQLELLKNAFVGNVVHQRSHATLTPLQVDAATVAEAKLYQGSEALGIGYIDAEGSRSDAILAAGELAGVAEYDVVDLISYYGFPFSLEYQEPVYNFAAATTRIFANAPANTVYFLDSRIPLPALATTTTGPATGAATGTTLQQHLLQLRAADPMFRNWSINPYTGQSSQFLARPEISTDSVPQQASALGEGN